MSLATRWMFPYKNARRWARKRFFRQIRAFRKCSEPSLCARARGRFTASAANRTSCPGICTRRRKSWTNSRFRSAATSSLLSLRLLVVRSGLEHLLLTRISGEIRTTRIPNKRTETRKSRGQASDRESHLWGPSFIPFYSLFVYYRRPGLVFIPGVFSPAFARPPRTFFEHLRFRRRLYRASFSALVPCPVSPCRPSPRVDLQIPAASASA